jgi:uncharacterized protein
MYDFHTLLGAMPVGTLLSIAAILCLSGVVSGLSGFGFSAIGATCLFVLPPTQCVPLLFALSTANQLFSLCSLFGEMAKDRSSWETGPLPYILGGLAGAPVGIWILTTLPTTALLLVFGGLLTAFSLYSLGRTQAAHSPAIAKPSGLLAPVLVGAIGGAVGGFTAFPSSPVVIWLGLTNTSKQQTRRVAQPFTLAMQLVSLGILLCTRPDLFDAKFWTLFVLMVPLVLMGTGTGVRIYRKISDFNFRRVVFLLLATSGFGLIAKNLGFALIA